MAYLVRSPGTWFSSNTWLAVLDSFQTLESDFVASEGGNSTLITLRRMANPEDNSGVLTLYSDLRFSSLRSFKMIHCTIRLRSRLLPT